MMRFLLCLSMFTAVSTQAASFEGQVEEWKGKPQETFSDPETNFKLVLKKLHESYIDREVSEAELYRAATAGMLAALNPGKGEEWNALLSPPMLEDFMI